MLKTADFVDEASKPMLPGGNGAQQGPPPLESGDRLTRLEFERRYSAMPQIKRAELIEGVVYMPSPVRLKVHGGPHSAVIGWLFTYHVATPGLVLGDNVTVKLDADNEVQPDALLRLEPKDGGRSRVTEDDYIEGAPEFIFEVAASSASYDLHDKKKVYRRNGVQEYAVWRVYEGAIDWFRLDQGAYIKVEPDAEGVIRSEVFPGLWLAVTALLAGDLQHVLAVLQAGLASAEHTVFTTKLAGQ